LAKWLGSGEDSMWYKNIFTIERGNEVSGGDNVYKRFDKDNKRLFW